MTNARGISITFWLTSNLSLKYHLSQQLCCLIHLHLFLIKTAGVQLLQLLLSSLDSRYFAYYGLSDGGCFEWMATMHVKQNTLPAYVLQPPPCSLGEEKHVMLLLLMPLTSYRVPKVCSMFEMLQQGPTFTLLY